MGAFLTFALDEGGALVHVDDVAKGMKCSCHCPHCNAPLYAKEPDKSVNTISHTPTDSNVKGRTNLHSTCSPKKFFRKPDG